MNEQQAREVLNQLEVISQRVNGGKYQGDTGAFLGFKVTDDMDKAFRSVGWMLVPVKM